MFFQSASKVKKDIISENKFDSYGQLQTIVDTLLRREVPSPSGMHQLLYHANLRLEQFRIAYSYHREHIALTSAIGLFHKEAYEETFKYFNQLQLLIDAYISLNIEENRQQINHRLSFKEHFIEELSKEITEFNNHHTLPFLEEKFWHAIKEDIMPILAELR